MLGYSRTGALYSDVCIGALSSMPRWHFARASESQGSDGATPRLSNALRVFRGSTSEMVQGRNVLVEHILNKDPAAGELRMALHGSLMRAYLYLVGKTTLLRVSQL